MPSDTSATLSQTTATGSGGFARRWFSKTYFRNAFAVMTAPSSQLERGSILQRSRNGEPVDVVRSGMTVADVAVHQTSTASSELQAPHDAALRRLLYVGPLTPQAGVADLFEILSVWADERPYIRIEVTWFGDGDLRGILQAQPLPPNMQQAFKSSAADCVDLDVSHYDLCVVPRDGRSSQALLAKALQPTDGHRTATSWTDLLKAAMERATIWICDPARGYELLRLLDHNLTQNITTG